LKYELRHPQTVSILNVVKDLRLLPRTAQRHYFRIAHDTTGTCLRCSNTLQSDQFTPGRIRASHQWTRRCHVPANVSDAYYTRGRIRLRRWSGRCTACILRQRSLVNLCSLARRCLTGRFIGCHRSVPQNLDLLTLRMVPQTFFVINRKTVLVRKASRSRHATHRVTKLSEPGAPGPSHLGTWVLAHPLCYPHPKP
jgi:hypothetical protein